MAVLGIARILAGNIAREAVKVGESFAKAWAFIKEMAPGVPYNLARDIFREAKAASESRERLATLTGSRLVPIDAMVPTSKLLPTKYHFRAEYQAVNALTGATLTSRYDIYSSKRLSPNQVKAQLLADLMEPARNLEPFSPKKFGIAGVQLISAEVRVA